MIRFDLELQMLEGSLAVRDLPKPGMNATELTLLSL